MTRFAVLPAAFIALAMSVCTSSAGATPRTAAERTHCLAIGASLSDLARTEEIIIKALKDSPGTQASEADRKAMSDMEELAATTARVGALLQERYSDADPPTPEERDAIEKMSSENLTTEAEACAD